MLFSDNWCLSLNWDTTGWTSSWKKNNLSIFKKKHFFFNTDFMIVIMKRKVFQKYISNYFRCGFIWMAQFEMGKLPNDLLLKKIILSKFFILFTTACYVLKIITDFAIQEPSSPIQIPSYKRLINQRLRFPPTVG